MSLVEVRKLGFSYAQDKKVLDNVSFNIEEGSYLTVIGHNGSGKSTLAKLIAGLLEANEGEIIIDGLKVNEANISKIRELLGIVFQNPDNQFIGSTVKDDIAFGLENRQVPSKDMDAIINEYAAKVGLNDFLDKEPTALSGGQKQRVAIAGVMAMKPKILIFDEATSMLDPKGKADIKELINKLHEDRQFTIISITHDIEEVLHSDFCLVLNKGQVFMYDIPSKIFEKKDELRKIDLDIPFNLKIKEALLKEGIKLHSSELEEMANEIWQLNSKN